MTRQSQQERDARAPHVIPLDQVGRQDVGRVGGKNASLGEMLQRLETSGIRVPPGFAVTAEAYWAYIHANKLLAPITAAIGDFEARRTSLEETGRRIRGAILEGQWPEETRDAIVTAYDELCREAGRSDVDVAVRSSATAEDLPEASFAGQQESFLNICGAQSLLDTSRKCYASLFTDRAIAYRKEKGFDHLKVALSVGVQRMVRADLGGSGVMFSIDTETGFDRVVVINAAWGLGENVVQGTVNPDEYIVFKPFLDNPTLSPIIGKTLGSKAKKMIYVASASGQTRNVPTSSRERATFVMSDEEILQLARWACTIEQHYGMPMDMEWAKDGPTGEIFIVQARPETVQSLKKVPTVSSYRMHRTGARIISGLSIGDSIVSGKALLIRTPAEIDRFEDGAILVTETTNPDWVPIMKRAAAIVTDHGGRTSHAAIVSRELGLPAVIGTGNATEILHDEQEITVSCAEGSEGHIYAGHAEFGVESIRLDSIPETRTEVMLNLANPTAAFRWWRLPADGVGLARMEFVIGNHIKVHPMALVRFDALRDDAAKREIESLTAGYESKTEYFVDRLARGLACLAAVGHPKPVIIRLSDFKTNEYANLIGGAQFEPKEENPMLGFRGASRYYSPRYRDGFVLECRAIERLRKTLGFKNVVVMVPFCRSIKEADNVLGVMAENGLRRGDDGLEIYVMCEIPSNVVLAEAFAERFDGFSIGSNDLTQLTLGVDRDSSELANLFDEQDEAVKWMIARVIEAAKVARAKIGLCGQAPSDYPEFARFLVDCGIDSISVSPDSFVAVKHVVAEAEALKAT